MAFARRMHAAFLSLARRVCPLIRRHRATARTRFAQMRFLRPLRRPHFLAMRRLIRQRASRLPERPLQARRGGVAPAAKYVAVAAPSPGTAPLGEESGGGTGGAGRG
jgi:hypothetical protein